MIVHEKWHGQGIGKELMRRLESIAGERECSCIEFCSSSNRVDAHLFYESLGYGREKVKGFRKFF
ncbi:MAG: GNAT family N-acetyltransferase [bacterium]|nr:GNAT family N-acetyltransferase [bacterium]